MAVAIAERAKRTTALPIAISRFILVAYNRELRS